MIIILDKQPIPEKGTFEIRQSVDILVSAKEARDSVNSWLLNEVSYMMGAEEPTLVVGDRVVWRVPAVLTAPHVGHVGMAGAVDVDVQTGNLNTSPILKEQILRGARELAADLPAYSPRSSRDVPAEYVAERIQMAQVERHGSPLDIINASRQRQSL